MPPRRPTPADIELLAFAQQAELATALRGLSWRAEGEPVVWFYDPPWTLPPMRRNEVAVRVEAADQ